jgi:hypothetical protein
VGTLVGGPGWTHGLARLLAKNVPTGLPCDRISAM